MEPPTQGEAVKSIMYKILIGCDDRMVIVVD
jgi:hypothetical protein